MLQVSDLLSININNRNVIFDLFLNFLFMHYLGPKRIFTDEKDDFYEHINTLLLDYWKLALEFYYSNLIKFKTGKYNNFFIQTPGNLNASLLILIKSLNFFKDKLPENKQDAVFKHRLLSFIDEDNLKSLQEFLSSLNEVYFIHHVFVYNKLIANEVAIAYGKENSLLLNLNRLLKTYKINLSKLINKVFLYNKMNKDIKTLDIISLNVDLDIIKKGIVYIFNK